MKETLKRVVPLAGLAASLWVLSRMVDLGAMAGAVGRAKPGWILCAAAAALAATVISALKFSRMLAHSGEPRSWRRCWSAIMNALGLNVFLPGKAGDFAKAVYLQDEGRPLSVLVGLVILERLADVGLLSLFALAGAISAGWRGAAMVSGAVLIAAAAGVVLLRFSHVSPAFKEKVSLAGHSAREFARKPLAAAEVLTLAALQWQMNSVMMYFLLLATGAAVPLLAIWTATPLALLAGVVPVTVSGIGTRDGVFLALLKDHAPGPAILAASFLYTALAYWFLGLLGILVAFLTRVSGAKR